MECYPQNRVYEPEADSKPEQPSQPIGYLGFKAHQEWAIQFNDCTAYRIYRAQPYQWFDRTSASVSFRYTFKPNDAIEPLVFHFDADSTAINSPD